MIFFIKYLHKYLIMLDINKYDSFIQGEIEISTAAMFCKLTKILNGKKYLRYLKFTISKETLNLLNNDICDYYIYKIIDSIKYESEVYKNIKKINILANDCEIYDNISCFELLVLLGLEDNEKILCNALCNHLYGYINDIDKVFNKFMFNVIDLPYVIYPSFREYFCKSKSELWFYIRKTLDIIKFYESIEFMHNDIHLLNIWIDKINKTPIIYDFNVSYHESIGDNTYLEKSYGQYNKYIKNLDMVRFLCFVYNLIHDTSHVKKFYDMILKENNEKNISIFEYIYSKDYPYYELLKSNVIRDIDELIQVLDNSIL